MLLDGSLFTNLEEMLETFLVVFGQVLDLSLQIPRRCWGLDGGFWAGPGVGLKEEVLFKTSSGQIHSILDV